MASDSLLQSKAREQSCEGQVRVETVKIVGAGTGLTGAGPKLDRRWPRHSKMRKASRGLTFRNRDAL